MYIISFIFMYKFSSFTARSSCMGRRDGEDDCLQDLENNQSIASTKEYIRILVQLHFETETLSKLKIKCP
jgi:hypothetical protein